MSAARSRVKTDVNMSMYTYIRRYIRIRYKSIHMCVCFFSASVRVREPDHGNNNYYYIPGRRGQKKKNTPRNYVRVSYRRSYRAQISTQ